MQPMLGWFITAVAFFILELATASFFFIWIGLGALATVAISYFNDILWFQCAAFAALSTVLVLVSRSWTRRNPKENRVANVDALVGAEGVVTKVEEGSPSEGYIKVDGQFWKTQTQDSTPLKLNEKVKVVEVKSNILVVVR